MKKINLGILFFFLTSYAFSQEWQSIQEFTHDFSSNGDKQGTSMKIDSNRVVIGVSGFDINGGPYNVGAVLILEEINGTWEKDTLIVSPDQTFDDYFGHAVDIDGDRIVVGNVLDDDNGNNSGSAFIFERNSTTGVWEFQQKITGPLTGSYDNFGEQVAIDGDWIAVSSLGEDLGGHTDVGIVDLFKYDGVSWNSISTIQGVPSSQLRFGYGLDMQNGDQLFISAPNYDGTFSDQGVVYEYLRTGDNWNLNATILSNAPSDDSQFGNSLSINGNNLVVGSPSDDAGRAEVFEWDSNSSTWAPVQQLSVPTSNLGDKFGSDVHIHNDRIVVGASFNDEGSSNSGLAYVFELENSTYELKQTILPPSAEAEQKFGAKTVVYEDYIIVSAPFRDDANASVNDAGYSHIYKYCKSDTVLNITSCDFYVNAQGYYTASGNFIDTIASSQGCDSIVTLNLTLFYSSDTTYQSENVCPGVNYTFPDGSTIENLQNQITYYSHLFTQNGCDSVIETTIQLKTQPSISFNVTNADCGEQSGAIDATVTGGNTFEYLWNNGSDEQDLEDIGANIYVLTVTNEQGCQASAQASVLSSELSIDGTVINNQCLGLTSGSVDLTVTGDASPFEFEWTNGAETEDISNLGAGVYEVIVTDANDCQSSASFEVGEPDAFEFESVVSLASCGTSNGAIDLTVSGGNGSYDFDWVDASNTNIGNTEDLSSIPQGLYTVTVTDANGCSASYQTNVSENGAPEIILDSFYVASCLDDGALFTSINSPNTIQSITWSNSETTDDITNLAEGSYSVSVEDNLGCVGTALFEVPSAIPSATQICLVTVDQNTNTNLVVWEKPISTDISSFVIYRESSVGGTFQALDTVLYSELSEYTDPNAFPHIRSWKYRIGTINTCGVESQLSSIHKTVHCAINAGLNGVYNIYWDNYEGFNYTTFEVWRHTTSNGWEEIESLAIGNNSYTDTPPETNGLDYYVAVSAPSLCSSSKANDYNTSRSNRSAGIFAPIDSTINVLDYESLNIQISPNPFNETLFIEGLENQTVKLFDIQGKLVKTANLQGNQVKGLGGLEHGVYLLEVMTSDKRIVRMKLVKQ